MKQYTKSLPPADSQGPSLLGGSSVSVFLSLWVELKGMITPGPNNPDQEAKVLHLPLLQGKGTLPPRHEPHPQSHRLWSLKHLSVWE